MKSNSRTNEDRPQNSEKLIVLGKYSNNDLVTINSASNQVKHFIGTIEIPGMTKGTACLLEDGTILTCLHNILDYRVLDRGQAELINFTYNDVSVYFVIDDVVKKYRVTNALLTGLNKLKTFGSKALCFDYAVLETDGNPDQDLGGGFKLDKTRHRVSAWNAEPSRTVAISAPFATLTEEGELKFHRFASISENQAAKSSTYQITQGGNHPSAPGFSGMGIVGIGNGYKSNTLYSIHSYRDFLLQQTGVKISEIRSSIEDNIAAPKNGKLDPIVIDLLKRWYEKLFKATINKNGSVTIGKEEIGLEEALEILRNRRGDIASDTTKEARSVAKKWSDGREPLPPHGIHKQNPMGKPHYHHVEHDVDPYRYPGHIFFPTQAEQDKKNKEAKDAGWAAKVEAAKLRRENNEKESKSNKKI